MRSPAAGRRSPVCAALVSLIVAAAPADAQISISRAMRWSFGGDIGVSLPKGEFDRHTKQGFGLDGQVIWAMDEARTMGLRFDLGYIGYGYRKDEYPCGTFCRYEATTTNSIIVLAAGPQFFLPGPRFTPYVTGGYGMLWFTTSSTVTTPDGSPSPFRHEVDANDITGSYFLAGGLYLPLGGRMSGIVANVGVRFFGGGEADYLTGDSVQDDGMGGYTIDMKHSRTEFWVVHVGISSSHGR